MKKLFVNPSTVHSTYAISRVISLIFYLLYTECCYCQEKVDLTLLKENEVYGDCDELYKRIAKGVFVGDGYRPRTQGAIRSYYSFNVEEKYLHFSESRTPVTITLEPSTIVNFQVNYKIFMLHFNPDINCEPCSKWNDNYYGLILEHELKHYNLFKSIDESRNNSTQLISSLQGVGNSIQEARDDLTSKVTLLVLNPEIDIREEMKASLNYDIDVNYPLIEGMCPCDSCEQWEGSIYYQEDCTDERLSYRKGSSIIKYTLTFLDDKFEFDFSMKSESSIKVSTAFFKTTKYYRRSKSDTVYSGTGKCSIHFTNEEQGGYFTTEKQGGNPVFRILISTKIQSANCTYFNRECSGKLCVHWDNKSGVDCDTRYIQDMNKHIGGRYSIEDIKNGHLKGEYILTELHPTTEEKLTRTYRWDLFRVNRK